MCLLSEHTNVHTYTNYLVRLHTKYTLQIDKIKFVNCSQAENQETYNAKNDSYFGDPFSNPNTSMHARSIL